MPLFQQLGVPLNIDKMMTDLPPIARQMNYPQFWTLCWTAKGKCYRLLQLLDLQTGTQSWNGTERCPSCSVSAKPLYTFWLSLRPFSAVKNVERNFRILREHLWTFQLTMSDSEALITRKPASTKYVTALSTHGSPTTWLCIRWSVMNWRVKSSFSWTFDLCTTEIVHTSVNITTSKNKFSKQLTVISLTGILLQLKLVLR